VTTKPIRILLAARPRMLLDMFMDIVAPHADMLVAGTLQDTANIGAAVKKARADVVILAQPAIGPPENYRELLYSHPHLRVLSITSDCRQFFLHTLQPVCAALGEVSPESVVQAIRSSARRESALTARLNGLPDKPSLNGGRRG
jgi:DNA-binding NarL/FixJ family response regulator